MTYLELVNKYERILKSKHLSTNASFLFLYEIHPKIKDLLTFSNYINDEVPNDILNQFEDYMDQYINKRKPLAYITHSTFFYGKRFVVNDHVLSPRNETEQWVELVLKILERERPLKILDLCCGTGVIGLTIKAQLPMSDVTLVDNNELALDNARENADLLNLKVKIINSNLFEDIKGTFDVILFNPPYIDYDYPLDSSVSEYEPYNALFSPNRGLYYYQIILSQISQHLNRNYLVAMEIGFNLGDEVIHYIRQFLNVDPKIFKDHNNHDRVVIVNRL